MEKKHFTKEEDTQMVENFPGGPVLRNPPANVRDMGSIPHPGRFRAVGQLHPCATTTKLALELTFHIYQKLMCPGPAPSTGESPQ